MNRITKLICLAVFCICSINATAQKIKFQKKWTGRSVLSQPKGFRPKPEIYLKYSYIKAFLKKFNHGASFLVTADISGKDFAGNPAGQFIFTKSEMDEILATANGKTSIIEKALVLPSGALARRTLFRIDIPKPKKFNIRIPSGNEPTANETWLPGGKLYNGYLQAVIDHVPKGEFTETKIN